MSEYQLLFDKKKLFLCMHLLLWFIFGDFQAIFWCMIRAHLWKQQHNSAKGNAKRWSTNSCYKVLGSC